MNRAEGLVAILRPRFEFLFFNIPQLTTDQHDGDNLASVEGNFAGVI